MVRKVAYGVPWISVDIIKSFVKTRWEFIDYSDHNMSIDDVIAQDPEGVIVFSPPKKLIEHSSVKWLLSPAAGVEHLDLDGMKKRGQFLINTHGNATTVAEHAWSLLLASARNLHRFDREVRDLDDWPSNAQTKVYNYDMNDKNIGIIGYGAIGQKIERFAKSFDMHSYIFRNSPEEGQYFDYELIEKVEDLDYLIIACPLTDKTRNLVSAEVIHKLPSHAIVVNIGRGEVLDEQALFNALREGSIRSAGIDTWQNSPFFRGEVGNKPAVFTDIPNLLISPHRAWNSLTAFVAVMKQLALELDNIMNNNPSANLYNWERGY